ncbi:IclR family transcriptional regulator [Haladaptatus caseinilyticus]|uniref:IclR family transcriptional regulator n=1 Tax=Haladaptatus caseinilyticus TaxID=2993314 RepID=UPI00224AA2D6|nr:IclR family transcriptional regulator [Haladaptatus caseinilyticus]
MSDDAIPLKTVHRAFEIIEILWEQTSATTSELAAQLDIPESTIYDYLQTLQSMEYVTRTKGEYRLSYKPLTIGGRVKYRSRLFRVAQRELQQVVTETGEVADINVEDSGQAVILHYERGEQALDLGMYPGMRTPLHTHASGKAILAHLPDSRVDEIIDSHGLESMTDQTVTSVETLKNELEHIREEGYAADWDQQVSGMGVIAAPILVNDDILGAVGIIAPSDRVQNESYQEQLQQRVREASSTISINYQYSQ